MENLRLNKFNDEQILYTSADGGTSNGTENLNALPSSENNVLEEAVRSPRIISTSIPSRTTFDGVVPWILFATLGGIMDGKCIYCTDRSVGATTLLVSWTLLPFFHWFFMCSFSFSCCQYLVLDVIPLFNVDCHRLRSG
jgi:hypothetical protein